MFSLLSKEKSHEKNISINILNRINSWIYFLVLCGICCLFAFLGNTFLYTDSLYYSSLGELYTVEQIGQLLDWGKTWKYIGYFIIPFIIFFRILYSSFCLFLGDLFLETHWGFRRLFKVSLLSDIVFTGSTILNFYYYLISYDYNTIEDLNVNFASLLKYTGRENIPNWLVFTFNSINSFELLYIFVLAFLICVATKINLIKALMFVFLTYGVGNYLYIASITFLYLNFY